MKLKASMLTIGVLACFASVHVQAQNFVTGPEYAPFTDPKLPEGGMLTDVIRQAYKVIGKDVTVTFLPWKRGYAEAQEGKFSGTFPYVSSEERRKDFLFSDSLYTVKRMVYIRADSGITYNSASDFKGRTACMENGGVMPEEVEAMIKNGEIKIQRPNDMPACVKMLEAGRADFFILNELAGNAHVRSANPKPGSVVTLEKPYAETGQFLLISKSIPNAQEQINEFNEALKKLKENGSYDKIISKHLSN